MKKKRYLVLGLALAGAVAIGVGGWLSAGPASAFPGNSCNPEPGHGSPGCHVAATTTTAKPTTTTAKPTTTTKAGPTTTKGGATTTTKAGGGTTTTTAGGPGTTSGTTTTTAAGTSTTVTAGPAAVTTFSDVPSDHPYNVQIADMVARGLISGDADGTFKPNLPMPRKDFVRMIVKALALEIKGGETSPFTDVVAGQDADPLFPDKYVAVAFKEGITIGKTPTTFAPEDDLIRQQLITMVVRAAKLPNGTTDFTPPFEMGQFVPDEHYANAAKAASIGLLDGLEGMGPEYDFLAPATRGEICFLLYKLLNM